MSKFNNFKNYNPDILETIANLSNDEVFTPPKLANQILDLLPEEVWSNPNLTFLDPAVKTGIFLREIASRLIDGLAEEIPDLQERVNHILTKQVFGIGITELTTLMARRTVYCSTTANGEFSICTEFDNEEGNILFPDTEHTWDKNGRCEYCGANSDNYGGGTNRENYAYPFIHDNFEKEFGDMKFDVIIGNPPYQLDVGNEGGNSFSANAIYHLFIDKALHLDPKYLSMIVPSRWMTKTAAGIPKSWMEKMIKSKNFKEIHDFEKSDGLFNGVDISGGVNYFLWDRNYNGKCNYYHLDGNQVSERFDYLDPLNSGVVIRNPKDLKLLKKILKYCKKDYYLKGELNFSSMVSPSHFFDKNGILSTNWSDYSKAESDTANVKYFVSRVKNPQGYGWIKESQIPKNKEAMDLHKIIVPGNGTGKTIIGKPRYSEPRSVCSQSYVVIGYDTKRHNLSKAECLNILSYMNTKLFRFMVKIKKSTNDAPRGAYQFVPLQDFSKPWTDEELYKKYKLTQEEIDYIEETIAPMPSSDD